ncbi:hypothetical protein H4R27_006172, partial [Coemansia aciculifera]
PSILVLEQACARDIKIHLFCIVKESPYGLGVQQGPLVRDVWTRSPDGRWTASPAT